MNTLMLLCAAAALCHRPDAAREGTGDDTVGSISGQVLWEGERPPPKPDLDMSDPKKVEGCKHGDSGLDKKDDTLLIDEKGGVANVVLTIEVKDFERKVPAEPIVYDQMGCRFHPHVVVVPVGATVLFDNSDDTNHNIHTYPKKNTSLNKNVGPNSDFTMKCEYAEVIDIKCDIHNWMKGYVVVTDATHYAISGADGSFKIGGLPPGEYEVSWWHEELGKGKTEKVKVEAGKEATLVTKVSAEKKEGGGKRRRP